MEQYWKSQRVYLFGQLTLFPQDLVERDLDRKELSHYYSTTSIDDLVADLRNDVRAGYFELQTRLSTDYIDRLRAKAQMAARSTLGFPDNYTPPGADYGLGSTYDKVKQQLPLADSEVGALFNKLARGDMEQHLRFKLTAVSQQKIRQDLTAYLIDYRDNNLTTRNNTRPANFNAQRTSLILAIRKRFPVYENRPIITSSDVPTATFWELVLTHHLITKEVEVLRVGYDDRIVEVTPGASRRHIGTKPFAEFRVVSETLKTIVSGETQAAPSVAPPAHKPSKRSVRIGMDNNVVYAEILDSGERYKIKKLGTDAANFNFMEYIIVHHDKLIPRGTIQTKVEGCQTKIDMSEIVRRCGFTNNLKRLKPIFFPATTAKKIYFKPEAELSQPEIDLIIKLERLE